MRRAARVDANQREIVNYLRVKGATVLITSQLKNCFDILIGYNGHNIIAEIKDGTKPESARRLTEGEQKFKDTWLGGKYHIIESLDDASNVLKLYK